MGRPTQFKDEYCEKLIEHMKQGYSYASFGAVVHVCEDTLYEWKKKHPSFAEAKRQGSAYSMHQWEKIGIAGSMGKIAGFNDVSWIFNMKNRFKWRDQPKDEESKETINIVYKK